jgi:SAM-dependent methyltransferase
MHASALEIGRLFFQCYWHSSFKTILDIGSLDVNGTLRTCAPKLAAYTGIDLSEGPSVDVVLDDPYKYPFPNDHFDLVISSSCFEHDPMYWLTFLEACRVLSPSGFLYVNAPSNGWYHTYPTDNWRFYPDAGLALQRWAERSGQSMHLIESFVAGRTVGDVWNDCVMVFSKQNHVPESFISDSISVSYNVRKINQDVMERKSEPSEDMNIIWRQDAKIRELTAAISPSSTTAASLSSPSDVTPRLFQFTADWFSLQSQAWPDLFNSVRPQHVLEIGSFEGRSACYTIQQCATLTDLVCIDLWDFPGEDVETRFDHNLGLALTGKPSVRFRKLKTSSKNGLLSLLANSELFDFIYIDGSHLASDVLSDAILAFHLLRVGGIMVFDDYAWRSSRPDDVLDHPKLAIDAFTNIFFRKVMIWPNHLPLYQLYLRKTSD